MNSYENSYWNSKGKYQPTYEILQALIPVVGEVDGGAKGPNKALEKLRKSGNCYYDLFNNGLCNRAAEFRDIFGFSPKRQYGNRTWAGGGIDFENEEMNYRMNSKIDGFIQAAAVEQRVCLQSIDEAQAAACNQAVY